MLMSQRLARHGWLQGAQQFQADVAALIGVFQPYTPRPAADKDSLLQGARQFQADVAALIGVFQPYTPRPAAHLRELAEACALLALEPDRAHAAAQRLPTLSQAVRCVEFSQLGISRGCAR